MRDFTRSRVVVMVNLSCDAAYLHTKQKMTDFHSIVAEDIFDVNFCSI